MHTLFIAVHAIAGVVALAAGALAVRRPAALPPYFWSLVTMAVFLALAVASGWSELHTPIRLLFAAFVALSGAMVWRAAQARRLRPADPARPSDGYLDHLGFTLIALFDAFVVIAVLDVVPGWAVAAAGVLVAIAGHFALTAFKNRLAATGSATSRRG